MRLCIITPGEVELTETFIRAHLERLPHDIVYCHGYNLAYSYGDETLRDRYLASNVGRSARWLNLLPRFMEFRIRRSVFPHATDLEIASDFLNEHGIQVVLAEYGTTAAFIAPACRNAGIPLVAHFHGFDASRYDILNDFREAYAAMFEYASVVVTVSGAMSRSLIEVGCPPEKIFENPYGPAPEFFDIAPNYQSNKLIAVGRHTAKKAPYLTLEAFRRAAEICPELELCMIGDGELFEVSERLVRAWDLQDRIELIGAAEPVVIRHRMRESFAFVQHSIQARNGDSEGTPVAILEAGAASLPVVSTRHAGIPEVVEDRQTGFIVEPGDVQGMADRIVELAGNRDLVRIMGEAACSRIEQRFSMKRHLADLDRILKSASDRRS